MKWKSLFGTFASILFGFALGMTSSGRMFHCGPPFGPPHSSEFLDHFAKEFSLNAEQKSTIGKLFEEQQKKVEALHHEVFPRFESLRQETRQKIRDALNEEQKKKFDELHAGREMGRGGSMHGGPMHGGPMGGGVGGGEMAPPPPGQGPPDFGPAPGIRRFDFGAGGPPPPPEGEPLPRF